MCGENARKVWDRDVVYPRVSLSALRCDLNWSAQHFSLFERTGVKPDEAATPYLLFRRATG